eukprot:2784731-Heterocapsa_arctica.AAC.1
MRQWRLTGSDSVYVGQRPTEVTFGRGALSVCPSGALWGPRNNLILIIGGVPQGSPWGPQGDKH